MTMKQGAGEDPFPDENESEETESMKGSGEIDFDDEEAQTTETADETTDEEQDLVDVLADALEDIEEGERNKTVSYRDDVTTALLVALDEDDDLREDLARDLGIALEKDVDPADLDSSETVRLLVRAGLKSASPETFEALGDARAELAKRSL